MFRKPFCSLWSMLLMVALATHLSGAEDLRPLTPAQQVRLRERAAYVTRMHALLKLGQRAAATTEAEKILAFDREVFGNEHDNVVRSLRQLGTLHETQEDFCAAGKVYEEVLAIEQKRFGPDHWRTTDARLELAHTRQLRELSADERRELQFAARQYQEVTRVLREGKYPAALDTARQVIEVRRRILGETHPNFASSLSNLAGLYASLGDYARAQPLLMQVLAIDNELLGEAHPRYASSLNNLAGMYESLGDYEHAESLYVQATSTWKNALGEAHPDYATSLNNLARVYELMGDYAQAEPLFARALQIRARVQGEAHPDYASSLNNLAGLYAKLGDFARAEPLYTRAMQVRRVALGEMHPHFAESLNNLAALCEDMGDHARAEPLFTQALEINKKTLGELHPLIASGLSSLAGLSRCRGEFAQAETLLKQSLAISKMALGETHPEYAHYLNRLAVLYESMGDFARAEPLVAQSLAINKNSFGESHPNYASNMINLAVLYASMGDHARAKPLLERAIEIHKLALGETHPTYAGALSNLAGLYERMGDDARSWPLFQQALEISSTNLELAAAMQSERQQLSLTNDLRYHFDAFLTLALRKSDSIPSAYRQALFSKGAVLSRQLANRALVDHRDLQPLLGKLQSVSSRIASLAFAKPDPLKREARQRQFAELTDQKEALERELTNKSSAYRRTKRRVTCDELEEAIGDRNVLVDYLEYEHHAFPQEDSAKNQWERRLIAFVVRRGQKIACVELGPVKPIAEAVNAWRDCILDRRSDAAAKGAAVRKLVWDPLAPHVGQIPTVLISPDGAVSAVPWSAMPGARSGSYLLEEAALVVVPVPRQLPMLLAPQESDASESASLLMVGDVEYGGVTGTWASRFAGLPASVRDGGVLGPFGRLEATAQELHAIRASFNTSFPAGAAQTLDRSQATESAFRAAAGNHRWMHIATHGFFAPAKIKSALATKNENLGGMNPFGRTDISGFHPGLLSGLALAGANTPAKEGEDDGILSALEISGLDLRHVKLATLSACETGLGEVAGGEGVLGLQRAFQIAGCRNVICSLWKVDDKATAALMNLFYHKLWVEGKTPHEALRQSQLGLLRHPEQIGSLAQTRGPDFGKVVKLVDGGRTTSTSTAEPRMWAGFVLSGTAQ